MKIELSLTGTRIFLLSLGLLLISLLMFTAGMVFAAGRVVTGKGVVAQVVTRKEQQIAAAKAETSAASASPALHRLAPMGDVRVRRRLTPIPVLNHPPSNGWLRQR